MTADLPALLDHLRDVRATASPMDGEPALDAPLLGALDAAIDLAAENVDNVLAPVIARLLESELIIRTCVHAAQDAARGCSDDAERYWAGYFATRRLLQLAPHE